MTINKSHMRYIAAACFGILCILRVMFNANHGWWYWEDITAVIGLVIVGVGILVQKKPVIALGLIAAAISTIPEIAADITYIQIHGSDELGIWFAEDIATLAFYILLLVASLIPSLALVFAIGAASAQILRFIFRAIAGYMGEPTEIFGIILGLIGALILGLVLSNKDNLIGKINGSLTNNKSLSTSLPSASPVQADAAEAVRNDMTPQPQQTQTIQNSALDNLEKLARLHDSGVLSDEEFETAKATLLNFS